MSGGFGRGKIVEHQVDSSYFPRSHFARADNGIEGNYNEGSDKRGPFYQSSFSRRNNFDEYNRSNRENKMEHIADSNAFDNGNYTDEHLSSRTFTRGGRSGFSADHMRDNGYSFNRENNFSSGFPTGRSAFLSSDENDSNFLAESGENSGYSSRGGSGNGFGSSRTRADPDGGFGSSSRGRSSGFGLSSSGRGGGFGPSDRDDGFDAVDSGRGGFGSRNGGRGGGFGSSDREDGFDAVGSGRGGFGSRNGGRGGGFGPCDRDDSFDAVGIGRGGFGSRNNGRGGGFGSSYRGGSFDAVGSGRGGFGSRNGGRGGGFGSSDRDDFDRDGFDAVGSGRGGFGSRSGRRGDGFGSVDRSDGFDSIDDGRGGFGSRYGDRGGGGFDSDDRGGRFGVSRGRRGNSFGSISGSRGGLDYEYNSDSVRIRSDDHFGGFRSKSYDFDRNRDGSFDKFGSRYNRSEQSGRSTNSFERREFVRSNFNNGDRRFNDPDFKSRFPSHIPEDRSIDEMYEEDAENAKYEISDLDQEVTITGVPQQQTLLKLDDWKNAGFGDSLLRNIIEKSCYSIPRRIQAAVIPLIQNGWDMVGQAETGSGKTAAFILPIISYIMTHGEHSDSRCAPIALVLAPTRELVGQLYNQARKFAAETGVTVAKAYGQYKFMENIMELERGCNILFATMGRLKDFVERGRVKLHNIKFFVLDEADRMLAQDSFQTDILSLVRKPGFPSVMDRQTLLFSATFTQEVQELAAKILKENHAFVSNGKTIAANPLVEQNFIEVTMENKFDKLLELLEEDREKNGDVARTLVFVQRKQMADVMALNLVQKDIQSSSISGDRTQKQREEALADFRRGVIKVLVATDVCARGIDVKDLEHVINYDMPNDRVTYVHRIGRTGRLHRGKATSFINLAEQDPALIADVVQVVQEVQQIPPDFLLEFVNSRDGRPRQASRVN